MRGLVCWVKVVWSRWGMGGNSQTVSWTIFSKVNYRRTLTQPGSEVNVSRKLLRLSFNVDKEKGVHATLLIVFVPSKGLAIILPYWMLSRRPLFDRADHLRVFRVGPEQIPSLFKIYFIKSARRLYFQNLTCSAFSLISLSFFAISILSTSSRYSFSVSVRPAPR